MFDKNLLQAHQMAFGKTAATAFAPGRVNLIGEYTDFNEGLVLPMPLEKGISIAIGMRNDNQFVARSVQFEGEVSRILNDKPNGNWTDYILGAVQLLGVQCKGLSVSVSSNLPVGASVSSSAALEVATLRALSDCFKMNLDDQEIARMAQRVENEFVGVQCGLMDQMVISAGKPNKALYFDTQSGEIQNHELIQETTWLTIHSGLSRSLKENAYNDRRASCERACKDMQINSLREANLEMLSLVKDDDDKRKGEHVICENARVKDAVKCLRSGDMVGFGKIMFEGHKSLSELFDVSTPQMDAMVKSAGNAGAIGARMTGAGFGGCIVVLTTAEQSSSVKDALAEEFPESWVVSEQQF